MDCEDTSRHEVPETSNDDPDDDAAECGRTAAAFMSYHHHATRLAIHKTSVIGGGYYGN